MNFIILETTSEDERGPIYVYVNVEHISCVSRFRALTNVYTVDGGHYVVKETPTEIFRKIEYMTEDGYVNKR